ncbi:hypothetical protein M9H77_08315 [Catharanthus roseus]|uniref:Uncharacterized protein n=1 Tax=Catharanthus roseus TaxID=4058 RepID=A0ACC0BXI9_CATRO|nr:hypothetical protein M9H77_08315 [Catharanthus roseus]
MSEEMTSYREMIIDAAGPKFIPHEETNDVELSNLVVKKFFDMLKAVKTPFVEGDDQHSVLSACVELLDLQSGLELKYGGYDPFVLGHQAEQLSFLPYIGSKRPRTDWVSVMKSRPRRLIDVSH